MGSLSPRDGFRGFIYRVCDDGATAELHLCIVGDDDVHCCVMAWNLIY